VGFAESILTSLIRIPSSNPKFWHYVTLNTLRVVPVRRAGYPTQRGETTRPPDLSRPPRRVCKPNVNSWLILQRNKLKVTSSRVTRGKGCLGYPGPYKWGLRPLLYGEKLSRVEGSPAYPSNPGRANFSYISLQNWRTVYTRNKKLARLEG